jgi:hypothetical protein
LTGNGLNGAATHEEQADAAIAVEGLASAEVGAGGVVLVSGRERGIVSAQVNTSSLKRR